MTLKWKIIAAIAVAGVVGVVLFHSPLLRGLARPLVVDQTIGDFDDVCLITSLQTPDGDRCYDVAADLYKKNPLARVLVVDPPPNRIVEAGAIPSFEAISRRELIGRRVPSDSIVILRSDGIDDWAFAGTLADRIREHPESTVLLLCSEFHSARLRAVIDESLEANAAGRIRIMPLSDRRFNRTDWWKTRGGTRELGLNWLIRLQGWLGDRVSPPPPSNADDYARVWSIPGGRNRRETLSPDRRRIVRLGCRVFSLGFVADNLASRRAMARRWRKAAKGRLCHGLGRR